MRTKAELLLAPKEPLKRQNINTGSLKVSLGNVIPGVISDPSQITGPVRSTFGAALANKATLTALATSVSSVLASFDSTAKKLMAGTLLIGDPLTKVKSAALPGVTDFMAFSSLRPGQTPPASFSKFIDARKQQLQKLGQSFASIFTMPKFGGVTLIENTNPDPYPHTDQVDMPSTPRLAQGGKAAASDSILSDKRSFVVQGVQIATGKPSIWSRLLSATVISAALNLNPVVNQLFKDRKKSGTWSEPTTPYAAQYPYNHVQQSESGHVIEIDDTPGAERVHIFHRAGSFIEFHPNGTVVYKNMKDAYDITMNDKFVKVNGKCHMAVDGGATIYVKGNADIQSDGDINVQAKGDFNVYAKNINLRAKNTFKADGMLIDLRYISLPFGVIPVFAGFAPIGLAPRINLAAIQVDFPNFMPGGLGDIPDVTADTKGGVMFPTPVKDAVVVPPENPLSNWGIYQTQTPAAINYRTRLFDTPEEVGDLNLFTAHQGLQVALGDRVQDSLGQLGGSLRSSDSGLVAPTSKPPINFLNFDDFKSTYSYANTFALGGTSFTLADVSDRALHADEVPDTLTDDWTEGAPEDTATGAPPPAPPAPPEPPAGGGGQGGGDQQQV